MQKAVNFLKNIKPSDDVVIIFNNDADGICSCALVEKLFEKTGKKKPYIIPQPMPMDKNLIQRIKTSLPTKIIFLDLAADQQESLLKKVKSICDLLLIDHHQVTKNMNSSGIIHYNPRFKNPKIYQSTSYLVYKICSEITNMSENLWIAAIGMIADYELTDSKDIIEEINKRYSIEDPYESVFSKIGDMISATRSTKSMSCEEITDLMVRSRDPDDFIKSDDRLLNSYKEIANEIAAVVLDAEKGSERTGKVILYNIKSKYNLRSSISSELSKRHPNKIVIVYQEVSNRIKVSARSQGEYDIGKLFQEATAGFDASAGGHENAAGATVEKKDWDAFKEKLTSLLE